MARKNMAGICYNFIHNYIYLSLAGVIFWCKIMSLQVQRIESMPVFFKNAVLFDASQKNVKKVKINSYTLFGEEILHKNVDILSIGKIAELIGNREADMGYITGASLYQNHDICLNHCCEASLTGLCYASPQYGI